MTLIPHAEPDSYFSSWGGHEDCADGQVWMVTSLLCKAYFHRLPELFVNKIGEGTILGQGVGCGENCTASYPLHTLLTLTATPNMGWQFKGWSGECHGVELETQVIMETEATHCTATFEKLLDRSLVMNQEDFPPVVEVPPSSPPSEEISDHSSSELVSENLSIPSEAVILPVEQETSVSPPPAEDIPPSPLIEVRKPSNLEISFLPEIGIPEWTTEGCPPTGFINMLCDNRNRVTQNATLGPRAILSGGELSGTIDNQWFVSQVTIQTGTVLMGGILSGYVFNHGTLAEITFVGVVLQGGRLAGMIHNESRVGGTLVDVTFAPNARLQGGTLQGQIRGDRQAPAWLERVKILKGSTLSGVKYGPGVLLEEGVKIEEE